MAPAGTFLRQPLVAPQPKQPSITIDSDDEGPTYKGDSSDEERQDIRQGDIKTTNFQRRQADAVPESPARGNSLFQSIISTSSYVPASNGVKRNADAMATAYGNPYKKPRQTAPSRALPVKSSGIEPDMDADDITDPNLRKKIRRMNAVITQATVRQCYNALMLKKGHYDDASDYLLDQVERQEKQVNKHIDLTGSDDELMPTPAVPRKLAPAPVKQQTYVAAKQQAKAPNKTIAEKWGSTQQISKPKKEQLRVFDTPSPKKPRTLIRGRKSRSSPLAGGDSDSAHIGRQVLLSDDSDEPDSGIHSAPEGGNLQDRLLRFFNDCTVADLVDTAVMKPEHAEHIVSKRPFKTIAAVSKIEAPDLKQTKNKRTARPLGERVADKVSEMMESYEAVDYLVRECDSLAKPLAAEIKGWGFRLNKSDNGELDLVSLDSQRSAHDSGIGTPVSDDDIKTAAPKDFLKQPSIMSMEYQLKDYQVVGMNWLSLLYRKRLSCILADDMGLGKTYQVIAFLSHLLETGDKGPHLIVVPAATLENWLQEFRRFSPALRVEPYYATHPGGREEIRMYLEDNRDDVNVVVTTYQLAKAKDDFPWLRDFGFRCTIFDEGHVLKNADSQVSRKLNRIKSKWRLLLTGTPLQNNLRELISLLAFMMPQLFQSKQEELKAIFTHNVKALDENHEALLSAQRIARARSMLTPFILRRKKHQVLKDLPKKDRRVEYCDLTPEQSEIYGSWLQKALDIRERRERGEETGTESTHILMKLRQAAIHPFLFRRLYKDDQLPKIAKQCLKDEQFQESNPDLIVTELRAYSDMEIHNLCEPRPALEKFALNNHEWLASGKVLKMLDLLHTYIAEGHRTLIFSQFTMVLDILELVLEREAIAYFRLDGSTKVSERQDLIDEFSADDNKTPVFMLSTRAGGAGINLAKANKVIVFDSGFNPQDDIQAENRAHRIGQVKDVEVVRLVSRGTVEEQIYKMGLTKLRLDEEVAGVGGEEGESEDKKKAGEAEETEKEIEGRKMVEEMFFKKLKEEPEEVVQEAKSPVQKKTQRPLVREGSDGADSQKTLKAGMEACDLDASTPKGGNEASCAGAEVKDEPPSQGPGAGGKAKEDSGMPARPKASKAIGGRRKSPKKGRK
jgi:SWI/SNF-related matrix-associated actin-dependent regulator of chromatin subfamily A containing DEAD/H box 1